MAKNLARLLIPTKEKEARVRRIKKPTTVTVVLRPSMPIRNLAVPGSKKFYPNRKGKVY